MVGDIFIAIVNPHNVILNGWGIFVAIVNSHDDIILEGEEYFLLQ